MRPQGNTGVGRLAALLISGWSAMGMVCGAAPARAAEAPPGSPTASAGAQGIEPAAGRPGRESANAPTSPASTPVLPAAGMTGPQLSAPDPPRVPSPAAPPTAVAPTAIPPGVPPSGAPVSAPPPFAYPHGPTEALPAFPVPVGQPAPVYPAPAASAPAPAPPPALAAVAAPSAVSERPGQWGAAVDFGFSGVLPDLGLLASWRPYSWLHAQAGVGWNIISPGVRCGATVVNPWIVPISLTGELGHYFEGDANGMIKSLTGQDSDIAVLRKVSYNYANALLGFTSRATHFVFYFRAGVTSMWATVNNFEETVSKLAGSTMETSDAKVSYYGPTAKFGLVVLY